MMMLLSRKVSTVLSMTVSMRHGSRQAAADLPAKV